MWLQSGSYSQLQLAGITAFRLCSREGCSCMPMRLPISSYPTDFQILLHVFVEDFKVPLNLSTANIIGHFIK